MMMATNEMIPIAIPNLTGNESKYLQECIDSTFVSSVGPFVTEFEKQLALASGAEEAVAVSSGTTGLQLALRAVGVDEGSLVLTSTYTFIASANAISHCGATPWLVDIDPNSLNMDVELLRRTLEHETSRKGEHLIHTPSGRRVSGILPVYALGLPPEMDELIELAQEFRLPVVADAAAAIGATYKGRNVAELGADLTVFSFNGNKTVTAGGGGGVVGARGKATELVRHLSTTARVGRNYDHDCVGFNYRMNNLEAAVGVAQLERLSDFIERKRNIREAYEVAFHDLPSFVSFPSPSHINGSNWFSGGIISDSDPDYVIQALQEGDIDGRKFWKPMHMQKPYETAPRTQTNISDEIWERVIVLPCSTNLTEDQQSHVIKVVRSALNAPSDPAQAR